MTRLLIAKRIGVERPATKQEVCQHWMVRREVWWGGRQLRKCAYCGSADWIERREGKDE